MEVEIIENNQLIRVSDNSAMSLNEPETLPSPFVLANTIESSLVDIREKHIIPVFIKDNEPVISHCDFIDAAFDIVTNVFDNETVNQPVIRLSHPIKGRIPEAKNKPANQLEENEKTLYYERMAFVIEVPTITDEINGSLLSLTIGGVKAYNLDNLHNKKGVDEHFKVFIGFQNKICTNLCIWTDGLMSDLKVKNLGQLKACIGTLIENYNATYHLHSMKKLSEHFLTESQFATLIGRCRMYNHLPKQWQENIPPLKFGDQQIGAVCKEYYRDNCFSRLENGDINLWSMYNLFTGANKSSYIDNLLERSVSAFEFVDQIRLALMHKQTSWYLS